MSCRNEVAPGFDLPVAQGPDQQLVAERRGALADMRDAGLIRPPCRRVGCNDALAHGALTHGRALGSTGQGLLHPLPTNGILVAITVMNCTFTSSGRSAMWTMALATCAASIVGSAITLPLACLMPSPMRLAISVRALPMSIWLQAMS